MPARGPHDDFESAKKVIRAGFAQFSLDRDLDAVREKYIDDDIEYVTRDGTLGADRWYSDRQVQMKSRDISVEVEESIDAGDGAVLLLTKIQWADKDTGKVVLKAWTATVVRVLDGKLVFFEGYVDRRKAFADLGLEET